MKNTAIFPGTFDPITNGHVDIVSRAAKFFDRVVVAVAASERKIPYFNLNARLLMVRHALSQFNLVEVLPFKGLLIDFAREHQVNYVVRGLRTVSDFDYEYQLAGMNHKMAPEIETVFLPAAQSHTFISATLLREILSLGGDIKSFVPQSVMDHILKSDSDGTENNR